MKNVLVLYNSKISLKNTVKLLEKVEEKRRHFFSCEAGKQNFKFKLIINHDKLRLKYFMYLIIMALIDEILLRTIMF